MGDKSRSPRNLSQAIIEIQELLDKYSDIYNPNTPAGQEEIGKAVIESISQNPTLKERVINAIKEGGYTAIDETIDHPAAKILMGTLIAFC